MNNKIIKIKVIPNSQKDLIIKESKKNEIDFVVKLNASPEKTHANLKLLKLLSEYFDCNLNSIKILSGKSSRIKIISIKNY